MGTGTIGTPALWIGFNICVLALLALDLGVFNRKAHVVSFREAAVWSAVWIGLSLLFAGALFLWYGPEVGSQFLTGYLIEKSLSVDNIFIFVLLFSSFAVPAEYQHRVLFWGVLGAIVMRGALIGLGTALVETFHWVLYLFGAFLVITGIRLALHQERDVQPDKNPIVRLARRLFPVTEDYQGARFAVRRDGRWWITPLLVVLLLLESTDLIFALDSIPAIFAITTDPFIVYTSNILAILGLRSLYFLLAGSIERFGYLKYGLAAILVLVGIKMLIADLYHMPIALSLGLIACILAISIGASLFTSRTSQDADQASHGS
ncbi:MAG TPA: TerC family protein [Ktedonobacterales bacterium]|nr:TerC family protein [Ktedonobacterales bacterium]